MTEKMKDKALKWKMSLYIRNKLIDRFIYNYCSIHPELLKEIVPKLTEYSAVGNFNINDVFIAGFPKSGNTLMQNIMTGIVYGIIPKKLHNSVIQELIPDIIDKKFYKRFLDTCFFKTHELPKPEYKKVIYIVRDGRDAMVSYYHMNKAAGVNHTIDEMIVEGKGLINTKWHIHTESWVKNPYSANIMFLKYEDLITNPLTEYKRICEFVNIKRDDTFLQDLVDACSFDTMRKREAEQNWGKGIWKEKYFFVRKGQAGDYVNELSESNIKHFTEESYKMLKHFNYI